METSFNRGSAMPNQPKSKAGQRVANWLEGLHALADSLGLRLDMDGSKFVIDISLVDASSGKRRYGPFKSLPDVEAKLDWLYRANGQLPQ
ncbi:MAG: hypothetical protein Q8M24_15550 [Pseudolabrys sp.]|nr:hypothetical protein [Pseudolabrys sp.]MDP2296858.1 hypothetical protein [Pseudolabrys sp.]